MPRNLRFWLNVILISAAHVVVIAGLIRWNRESKTPDAQSIVWMNGSSGDGAAAPIKPTPAPKPLAVATPEPAEESQDDQPTVSAAKSDIQLPTATPKPTPRSTSTPRPTANPARTPSPKIKVPPKPTPKPKPKPTASPKPSPKKLVVAKASPKPTATPAEEDKQKDDVDLAKKPDESPKPNATPSNIGKTTSAGNGGRPGGGASMQAQFGWYGSMLHDRFYSEWAQPKSVAATAAKNSVLVKLRIEKDGRISSFDIVRSSGDAAVDESVNAVAKRVTQVDPLPAGLGSGEHYDVKINFELSSE